MQQAKLHGNWCFRDAIVEQPRQRNEMACVMIITVEYLTVPHLFDGRVTAFEKHRQPVNRRQPDAECQQGRSASGWCDFFYGNCHGKQRQHQHSIRRQCDRWMGHHNGRRRHSTNHSRAARWLLAKTNQRRQQARHQHHCCVFREIPAKIKLRVDVWCRQQARACQCSRTNAEPPSQQ